MQLYLTYRHIPSSLRLSWYWNYSNSSNHRLFICLKSVSTLTLLDLPAALLTTLCFLKTLYPPRNFWTWTTMVQLLSNWQDPDCVCQWFLLPFPVGSLEYLAPFCLFCTLTPFIIHPVSLCFSSIISWWYAAILHYPADCLTLLLTPLKPVLVIHRHRTNLMINGCLLLIKKKKLINTICDVFYFLCRLFLFCWTSLPPTSKPENCSLMTIPSLCHQSNI